MKPVLFYGVPEGCSFGSIVALEWLGRPYRLCRIDMMQRPWDPAFARLNPHMKTPALLLENGESLTESLAILQNIAARDLEAKLGFAQGSMEFDRLNEMLSYLTTDFFSAFSPLWTLYEAEGLSGSQQDILHKLGSEGVANECAYLDRLLAGREWLIGGTQRTVADAYLAGIGRWVSYHKLFDLETAYPNLARYLNRLGDDSGVRFATAIENGEDVRGNGDFKGHVTLAELAPRLAA